MTGADIAMALEAAGTAVLVVVTEALGSTPREVGAPMLVTGTGQHGTIGGGTVEHRCQALARAMLRGGERHRLETFPLGPTLDQCCGGRMTVALVRLTADDAGRFRGTGQVALWLGGPVLDPAPAPRPVIVYGAGHVGTALVRALAPLPFALRWVDGRAGVAPAVEGLRCIETPLPEAEAAGAMHLVMTHSHAVDLEIVAAALASDAAFIGLIGSATKRATFLRRLRARGIAEARLSALTCPIGLPGLRDKRPAIIAASVAAQLIQYDAALALAARGAA